MSGNTDAGRSDRLKILITGANGMLGFALGRALGAYELYGLGLGERGEFAGKFYPADITDAPAVNALVGDMAPHLVIHAAAYTDVDGCERRPEEAERVNVQGTVNVVKALKGRGIPLVFISTDYVFDGKKNSPYDEDDTPCAVSAYGRSKQKAEQYIRENSGPYLIVRTSWLYGPKGKNFVDTVLRLAEEKESLSIVSDQRGRPTYTLDLAEALKRIAEHYDRKGRILGPEISGVMQVSNSGEATWCEFAAEILKAAGKKVPVKAITSETLGRPAARPSYSIMDLSRFEKFAGRPLRHWKEAVASYVAEWKGAKSAAVL